MQVTPEMIEAARASIARSPLTDAEIGALLGAGIDAMPAATGGYVPGPAAVAARCCVCNSTQVTYRNYLEQAFCGPCADGEPAASQLRVQPARIAPPPKVHDAAGHLPGIAFNLNQRYDDIDPAAAQKLHMSVRAIVPEPEDVDG